MLGLALIAGCTSSGGGDRGIPRRIVGTSEAVHTITAPYSQWSDKGFAVTISSEKQAVVVDGFAEPSIFNATVSLFYDTNKLIVDATGPANDFVRIPVHGDKPATANLIPKGAQTLTLRAGANTVVAPETLFTVTITEIDPM
jgi:hypothetical protein